eukprot:scaffold5607_cov45-Cyclotella_meneghiniana.AAC.1
MPVGSVPFHMKAYTTTKENTRCNNRIEVASNKEMSKVAEATVLVIVVGLRGSRLSIAAMRAGFFFFLLAPLCVIARFGLIGLGFSLVVLLAHDFKHV